MNTVYSIYSQKSASIQPRTSPPKFGKHLTLAKFRKNALSQRIFTGSRGFGYVTFMGEVPDGVSDRYHEVDGCAVPVSTNTTRDSGLNRRGPFLAV